MSKRVFTFDGLVNAEINSIEAVAGVLGWFLAIGAGNQTDEEFEEKIDLVFHCWLPILNNNFLLYETFKEMIDRGEDAPMDTFDDGRPFLDYKSIPKTEFTLTRSDLINIQTEVANNLDPDTNLMFFEQAASRVESIGLGLVTIAIANGIADAGDGIDENENAMLERMFAIYGTERGNEEILQSDVWMMMELNGVMDEEGSIENGKMGEASRAFYREHYDDLDEIENLQEYNEKISEIWSDYNAKTSGGGACFIATATLGENDYRLSYLRNFRDEYLLKRDSGVTFVKFYYKIGPSLSKILMKHKLLNFLVRNLFIVPISYLVKKAGYR